MRRFDAVLFDLGNTLLYFDGDWPTVFSGSDRALWLHLQSGGIQLDEQRFLTEFRQRLTDYYLQRESDFIEHTTRTILQALLQEWGYQPLAQDVLDNVLRAMYTVSQAHWHIEDDTHETLAALQAAGYQLGILSNAANDADVQALVDKAEIRPYFDFVLSSAACGVRKPSPQIFKQTLTHWELRPEQIVMVGDTLNADILGARNIGMFGVWITRRADTDGNRDHKEKISPDATIQTLKELPPLLSNL